MAAGGWKHGEAVWCKCGGLFWPGEVQTIDRLPKEIQDGFLKTPKVIVKFFDEDGYEFVLNDRDIFPYNCEKKNDFIAKGLARAKTKAKEGATGGWFAKFPSDVIKCEKLTGGNVNILEEEPFVETKVKKVDYSLIFGDQEEQAKRTPGRKGRPPKELAATTTQNGAGSPAVRRITHPRFLSGSDHTVRILSQPSTPYHVVGSTADSAPQPTVPRYNCHLCGFAASRLNVIVLHTKSHSEPSRTSLANHARPERETPVKAAAARSTPARKRVLSPKVKGESVKKPRLSKKEKELKKEDEKGKEEKKKAIFGDWSEDEIEEIEEKEKLKESIANNESGKVMEGHSDEDSIDDMFNFTDDHHSMDSEDDISIDRKPDIQTSGVEAKPLRRRKADLKSFIKEQEITKPKRKVYEKPVKGSKVKTKPSAADTISSLIKSNLEGDGLNKAKKASIKSKTSNKPTVQSGEKIESVANIETSTDDEKVCLSVAKVLPEPTPSTVPEPASRPAAAVPTNTDVFEGNFSSSESAAEEVEPASPPPTRRPGILRRSSHLSIQLPTRPNGNAQVIRHESASPTKYAAISAKAKAKQLARSAHTEGTKNELANVASDLASSIMEDKKVVSSPEVAPSPKTLTVEEVCVVAIDSVATKALPSTAQPAVPMVPSETPAASELDPKPSSKELSVQISPTKKSSFSNGKPPTPSSPAVAAKTTGPAMVLVQAKSPSKPPVQQSATAKPSPPSKSIVQLTSPAKPSATKAALATSPAAKPTIQLTSSVAKLVSPGKVVTSPANITSAESQTRPKTLVTSPSKANSQVVKPAKMPSPAKVSNPAMAASSVKLSSPVKATSLTKPSPPLASPAKVVVSPLKSSVSKPNTLVANLTNSSTQATSPGKPSTNQVRLVHNPVILPKATSNTMFLQKAVGGPLILPKPLSRPILLPKPHPASPTRAPGPLILPKTNKPLAPAPMRSPNSKPTMITVGKAGPVAPPRPIICQRAPVVVKAAAPVVGPRIAMPGPPASLGSDKPVVAGVSKPVLGGISLSKPPVVGLLSPHKEPEKPLTFSLEAKRPAAPKAPLVKTVELPRRVLEATRQAPKAVVAPEPVEPIPEPAKQSQLVLEGASLGAESLAALSQLQMIGEDGVAGEEMIYLLVDDGTDPNLALENQTLYIDPSQLAAAMAGGDMILQGSGGAGEGQVLMMMPEESQLPPLASTLGLVTSADTSGGIATLPSHPSSSLLAQVPLISTPSQQGPIMVSGAKKAEQS